MANPHTAHTARYIAAALALLLSGITLCAAAEPQPTPAPAISVTYTLPQAGQVSLGVFDSSGRLVRTLLCGEKQTAGPHTIEWDGLDRYGRPQPPAQYEWRLLRTPGFSREFLVNIGVQTPWAPYGVWPGNHFGPNCVRVGEDGALYVGAVSSEGPPHLLKMALDGSREFWDTGTWGMRDGLREISQIGDKLYLLMGTDIDIRRTDDGLPFAGAAKPRRTADAREAIHSVQLLHEGDDRAGKISPMSMTGGRESLVVTYQDHNEVRFLWPGDGAIARAKTIAIDKPVAAAVAGDGRVFVVSAGSIVQVDPETGKSSVVVHDLPEPGRLACDPAFDDLLVVCARKSIRRYHIADGKLIAVYGRPEGREFGLFKPLDFDDILDTCADGKGGFVTVEQYPRRVAHFRGREKHELVNQWIGGMQWGSVAVFDPADPTIVYVPIDPRHLARGKIDFARQAWTLTHLYDSSEDFSWYVGKDRHRAMLPPLSAGSYWDVVHRAGATYLVNRGRMHGGGCTIVRVDETANKLVPIAHIGGMHPTVDRNDPPAWWVAACQRAGFEANSKDYTHFAFSWSDTNHNGKVDVDEIKLGSHGSYYVDGHCFVDDTWNVYLPTGGPSPWTMVPNEGTADLPVWDWNHARPAEVPYNKDDYDAVHPSPTGIWRDATGSTYLIANNGGRDDHFDIPPLTWPNNTTHSQRIMKWDAAGKLAFSVGRHTARKDAPPGEFANIRAILGQVRDCLVVMDACSAASVWTSDGLYAGALNDDVNVPEFPAPARGEAPSWQARAYRKITHDDNQWSQVAQSPAGDVLWGLMRDNNTAMYRITGWDNWEHQQGSITLATALPAPRHAGDGLAAAYYASNDLSGNPALVRTDPAIWFGPMWGDHREVKTKNDWFAKDKPAGLDVGACSARWTGSIEAPVSEDFTFHLYTFGRPTRNRDGRDIGAIGARVRLWIGGRLVIDSWENTKPGKVDGYVRTRWIKSDPVPLGAGQPVPIKLEYAADGQDAAHLHLYWESRSTDLRHVPASALYLPPTH